MFGLTMVDSGIKMLEHKQFGNEQLYFIEAYFIVVFRKIVQRGVWRFMIIFDS